jgi:hypothetical protein
MDENLVIREKVLPLFSEAHELSSIFVATRKTAQGKRINQKSTIINHQRSDQ